MAETAVYSSSMENHEVGCGFGGLFFQRKINSALFQGSSNSKRKLSSEKYVKPQFVENKKPPHQQVPVPVNNNQRRPPYQYYGGNTISATARSSVTPSKSFSSNKMSQVVTPSYIRRSLTKQDPTLNSGELGLTTNADHQRKNSESSISSLHRASTGNVMLLGHLGNLKQNKNRVGSGNDEAKNYMVDNNGSVLKTKKNIPLDTSHQLGNIYSGGSSMNRMDPDTLKSLGNDKYKHGKFEEALALYNQAIAINPRNPCYYSNKSAALMGLGRLVEAVIQCREAIKINPSYHNAHYRLAKLYLRLGTAERALHHFRHSGGKAGPEDFAKVEALQNCIDRSCEAQSHSEWREVLNESQAAISLGADTAPQIYAMRAEALTKLGRHEEAFIVLQKAPDFSFEAYADLLGSSDVASLLEIRSMVYLSNGRFDEAVAIIQQALKVDSSSRVNLTADRVKSVASARSCGNRLFKESRYSEALMAYNRGLQQDPQNSVLLCNRAACRYKLGQYEKAVEDCTSALLVRPSYSKARLRRANCYAELEKWDAAIQDYEVLTRDMPGDEQVSASLSVAKMQLNKLHNMGMVHKLRKSQVTVLTG